MHRCASLFLAALTLGGCKSRGDDLAAVSQGLVFADQEPVLQEVEDAIREFAAARHHRLSHYLWHGTRNGWNDFDDAERALFLELYKDWEPPRPLTFDSNNKPKCTKWGRTTAKDCVAGEDFLYMHRTMISQLNAYLKGKGLPEVKGWASLPGVGDRNYSVPEGDANNPLQSTDPADPYFETMRKWEMEYRNEQYLDSVSLGELGLAIEFTLHNWMHMRWAEPTKRVTLAVPLLSFVPSDWTLDAPEQDWLGSPYTAHVNKIFWKLHGWVDARIDDWLVATANNHVQYERLGTDSKCTKRQKCYRWKGTWAGGHSHVNKAPGPVGAPRKEVEGPAVDSLVAKLNRRARPVFNTPLDDSSVGRGPGSGEKDRDAAALKKRYDLNFSP